MRRDRFLNRDVGLATASLNPGQPAPSGTEPGLSVFDSDGNPVTDFNTPIDGRHSASFPFSSRQLSRGLYPFVICLNVPGTGSDYMADATVVGVKGRGSDFQFEAPIFADGFESGDTSAWTTSP